MSKIVRSQRPNKRVQLLTVNRSQITLRRFNALALRTSNIHRINCFLHTLWNTIRHSNKFVALQTGFNVRNNTRVTRSLEQLVIIPNQSGSRLFGGSRTSLHLQNTIFKFLYSLRCNLRKTIRIQRATSLINEIVQRHQITHRTQQTISVQLACCGDFHTIRTRHSKRAIRQTIQSGTLVNRLVLNQTTQSALAVSKPPARNTVMRIVLTNVHINASKRSVYVASHGGINNRLTELIVNNFARYRVSSVNRSECRTHEHIR